MNDLYPRRLGPLHLGAVSALALFLNGLCLWDFLLPHTIEGGRALVTGAIAVGLLALLGVTFGRGLSAPARLLIGLLLLQVGVLTAALLSGGVTDYGRWKLQGFLLFAVLPSLAILWVFPRQHRLTALLYRGIFVLAFLPLLVLLPFGISTLMDGITVPWMLRQVGTDTIGLSRAMGLGAFLALAFLLRARGMGKVALAGCLLLLALGQFWLGQRGPVLALAAGAAYLLAITTPHGARLLAHRGLRYGLLALLLLGGIVLLPRVLPRIKLATVMADPRMMLAQEWTNLFLEHPLLGIGVGAFSYGDLSDDPRAYAHNIFGELLSESGLLGFGLFLLFLVLTYRFARQARDGLRGQALFWHQVSLGMTVYTLATAQVSGDLTTNYMVWVSLALVYATAEPGRAPVAETRAPYPWEIIHKPTGVPICASSS